MSIVATLPAKAEISNISNDKIKVKYHEVARERLFEGVVEAVKQSTVSAQTSGRIVAVHFDVNDRVKKGDLLVELDNTQQTAQLEEAKASVSAAKARLKEAEQDFERVSMLYKRGAISKARNDQSKAELDSASAGLKRAQAALKQAEEQN